MTIAEVSKKYEISADTLRYYERVGLIPPVPRTSGGIRDYDEASCGWIELMKCLRAAGVQIEALSVEDNGKSISFNVFCYNCSVDNFKNLYDAPSQIFELVYNVN